MPKRSQGLRHGTSPRRFGCRPPGVLLARASRFQTWSDFWTPFLTDFNRQNGPQYGPKIGQQINKNRFHFWIPSFLRFCSPFRSSWEPSWTFRGCLGRPWTPKTLNTYVFKVFANAGFPFFETVDGPLGPILVPLGPIRSQNGF